MPYIHFKYSLWDGEKVKISFGYAEVEFVPPHDFDVGAFQEGIRENIVFELTEEEGLELEVSLEGEN